MFPFSRSYLNKRHILDACHTDRAVCVTLCGTDTFVCCSAKGFNHNPLDTAHVHFALVESDGHLYTCSFVIDLPSIMMEAKLNIVSCTYVHLQVRLSLFTKDVYTCITRLK